ncbi:MAG: DUF6351 family protein [Solirubrobacterales bacterium]
MERKLRPSLRALVVVSFACLGLAALAAPAAQASGESPKIEVLSNRGDLLSQGDALVAISLPKRASKASLDIELNGEPVGGQFRKTGKRDLEGLLKGMQDGGNVLTVMMRDGRGAKLKLRNHPNGGPIFSGPQVQPWKCQATAVDAQCNENVKYGFFYKSTDPAKAKLQPYDTANPPSDVATTTTENGESVPFIVRIEVGYQDRDQYKIATLFDPTEKWTWRKPQPQYAGKMLITHGFGCDLNLGADEAPDVLSYQAADASPDTGQWALGKGWVVMSTSLDHNSHSCNPVVQAESLMMAKERVVERYGPLDFTVGVGCSGGSLTQQWVANAYPGIYQGVLLSCSFPDAWTSATQVFDYHIMRPYLEDPAKWDAGVTWTPAQSAAVLGSPSQLNSITSDTGFYFAIDPTHACDGPTPAERYNALTNPGGARCSIADIAINQLGPRPQSSWSAPEQQIGRGFAGVPIDNVGVQYGLSALQSGTITPAQFVDLNAKVGGVDNDAQLTPERRAADEPALANAYRSGLINEANNYDRTAIIDCRGPDPGYAHDSYRAFAVRDRLDREHGTHANQLIWEGPYTIGADLKCAQESLEAMDRWLTAVAADTSDDSTAEKLIADKPSDLSDRCYDGAGNKVSDSLCPDGVVPVYGTPRTVAGESLTTDANKCQLKPLRQSDYSVSFTSGQWATLQGLFPQGVCDYSKPGVDQQGTVPWQTYQDNKGNVIYGGEPLGKPPRSKAIKPKG